MSNKMCIYSAYVHIQYSFGGRNIIDLYAIGMGLSNLPAARTRSCKRKVCAPGVRLMTCRC